MKCKLFIIVSFVSAVLLNSRCKKAEIVNTKDTGCSFADSSSKHPKYLALNALMQKYIRKGLPGMSILIQDSNGVCVGSCGLADIESSVKFSPCQVSKAASITKLLVGSMVLKLQEEGKLNINDPINKYIDQTILKRLKNSEGKTMKQLMNHSTGIYDLTESSDFYLAVINNPTKRWTPEELLEFAYDKEPEPLSDMYPSNYSNTNTALLIMCVEKITGENHLHTLRRYILDPLGMTNTYYQSRESVPSSAAQGYYDLHSDGTLSNVSNFITGSGNGYGGIFSNIYDLHKFSMALFKKKTLLSAASLNQMLEFNHEDDDFYCGVSTIKKFTKKQYYGIGHTGRDLGYSADLFYFPEKRCTMIFFVNYGTNAKSALKSVFLEFESELCDLTIQ